MNIALNAQRNSRVHTAGAVALAVGLAAAPGWGASPLGQVLLGTASMILAALLWAGHSIQPLVGWSVAATYLVLNIVGCRVESQAHAHRSSS
jgi:hypothetical protein